MKTSLFITLFLLLPLTNLVCQNKNVIVFDSLSYSFGLISSKEPLVEKDILFKNKVAQPIKLTEVKANCECIELTWPKEKILPGKKGQLKVKLNSSNTIGPFNSLITIQTNYRAEPFIIRISGNVVKKHFEYENLYPDVIGNIRFKSRDIELKELFHNQKDTFSIEILNEAKRTINFDLKNTYLPDHITVRKRNFSLDSAKTKRLIFTYHTEKKMDWGKVYDYIQLVTNDKEKPLKRIRVGGKIKEKFDPNQDKNQIPIIIITESEIDLGEIEQFEKKEISLIISNKGKANLLVRKIENDCGCNSFSLDKKEILPNEKAQLTLTISSGSRSGLIKEKFTIINNDSSNPEVSLIIKYIAIAKKEG